MTTKARTDDQPMLSLQGTTAGYGDTTVLRDITITVAASTVVALLGPNGAGKTTLLRVASGMIRPSRGQVFLDGMEMTGRPPDYFARRGLCHLPEGRGIFPSLSVRENLILQSPKGGEAQSLERAVTLFPVLGSRLRQVAGTLSGGEQQMLALVRAFLSEPKIVVIDEASLGLAPVIVDQVFEAIAQIAASGAALLLVEQYLTRALAIADMAYLINQGRIVFEGPADDLSSTDVFEQYLGIDNGTTDQR